MKCHHVFPLENAFAWNYLEKPITDHRWKKISDAHV